MTPFGSAVEPEVYWSNARVLLVTAGSRHSCARLPATLSVSLAIGVTIAEVIGPENRVALDSYFCGPAMIKGCCCNSLR